ncbi:transcriptional regulator, sarp family [Treponema primitia ZAS-2]|uniref:Transcriptional regulator, sarp family n=1 Tax=Treponema primitia (strain ATCC BAA-887 / DSM 12427 / ZAS-2) TaxID=545694 RepID=F5YJ74_TREPZ|nr:hypothetical protein [Treponema primitia]AEF86915.1 transcriptional regulator, sarp family [Treponema primitia ZAS-2]
MLDDNQNLTQAGVNARRSVPAATKAQGKTFTAYKPYTPQFSAAATVTVRRLAWALGCSMPAAVSRLVELLPSLYAAETVCSHCQDKEKCSLCSFKTAAPTPPKDLIYL